MNAASTPYEFMINSRWAELIAGELGGEFAQHHGFADHGHQLEYASVL
jgi:hypothetical protein